MESSHGKKEQLKSVPRKGRPSGNSTFSTIKLPLKIKRIAESHRKFLAASEPPSTFQRLLGDRLAEGRGYETRGETGGADGGTGGRWEVAN